MWLGLIRFRFLFDPRDYFSLGSRMMCRYSVLGLVAWGAWQTSTGIEAGCSIVAKRPSSDIFNSIPLCGTCLSIDSLLLRLRTFFCEDGPHALKLFQCYCVVMALVTAPHFMKRNSSCATPNTEWAIIQRKICRLLFCYDFRCHILLSRRDNEKSRGYNFSITLPHPTPYVKPLK